MNLIYTPTPVPSRPGVYVDIDTPTTVQEPTDTGLIGLVGEFPRGPLDTSVVITSYDDLIDVYGGVGLDANGLPYSGPLAVKEMLEEGVTTCWITRVASSLCATGYLIVSNGTGAMVVLHAKTPGTWGNALQFVITQDTVNNVWGLVVTNPVTGEQDNLQGLPYTNNATLISQINASAQLVTATQPVLQAPSAAPTITASTVSGTVPQATAYYGIAVYKNAAGQPTQGSPETAAITGLSGAAGTLTASVPTQSGAATFDLYLGTAPGQETYAGSGTPGTNLVISTPWAASTKRPPTFNSATTGAGDTSALPNAGTFSFPASQGTTGRPGNDGTQSGAARHVGVQADGTGVYSLLGFNSAPDLVLLAGAAGTDSTQWAALDALGKANGFEVIAGFPSGTTAAGARSAILAAKANLSPSPTGDHLKWTWPEAVVNEPVLGGDVTVASTALFAAKTAVTPVQKSTQNKPIVASSFRRPSITASGSDIDSLNDSAAGVYACTLTTSIPKTGTGWFTDRMASGANSFEVRVRTLIAKALYAAGGQYEGEDIDDALMAQAETDISGLMQGFADDGVIPQNPAGATTSAPSTQVSTPKTAQTATSTSTPTQTDTSTQPNWLVIADTTNNPPSTQANGELHIKVESAIKPNADRVIFDLQAGVGIVITPPATATA